MSEPIRLTGKVVKVDEATVEPIRDEIGGSTLKIKRATIELEKPDLSKLRIGDEILVRCKAGTHDLTIDISKPQEQEIVAILPKKEEQLLDRQVAEINQNNLYCYCGTPTSSTSATHCANCGGILRYRTAKEEQPLWQFNCYTCVYWGRESKGCLNECQLDANDECVNYQQKEMPYIAKELKYIWTMFEKNNAELRTLKERVKKLEEK